MPLKQLEPVAIANIDCDLYSSTCEALEILAPKLLQGTVLLVDDWNSFSASRHNGQRKAVHEFLERSKEWSFEPWFPYEYVGQAFLVHKAA